jgi:hypothetical protein
VIFADLWLAFRIFIVGTIQTRIMRREHVSVGMAANDAAVVTPGR